MDSAIFLVHRSRACYRAKLVAVGQRLLHAFALYLRIARQEHGYATSKSTHQVTL